MRSSAPESFDQLREQVEAMIAVGEPFAEIERAIEGMTLSEERKAALWLVGWSLDDLQGPNRASDLSARLPRPGWSGLSAT